MSLDLVVPLKIIRHVIRSFYIVLILLSKLLSSKNETNIIIFFTNLFLDHWSRSMILRITHIDISNISEDERKKLRIEKIKAELANENN